MAFGTARAAVAQTARPGTLQVTVDQSGAVIGNATVTVEGAEAATKGQTPAPVQTNAQGIANLAGLPPGRYAVRVEFPGFETRTLPEVRVRAGDNKQVMMLPIAGVQDSVTVERNKQETAADRQRSAPCSHASSSRRCRTTPHPAPAAVGHGEAARSSRRTASRAPRCRPRR
jgi:hypothetical protein